MKRSILLSFIIATALFSCKKSNSGSGGNHMKATIDGKAKNFSAAPVYAYKAALLSAHDITVGGTTVAGVGGETMTLVISSENEIVAGTYTDETDGITVSAIYGGPGGSTEWAAGTSIRINADYASVTIKNHFKLVISAIDSKSIKGTFSGDLYQDNDVQTTPKTMTDGDFSATFTQ